MQHWKFEGGVSECVAQESVLFDARVKTFPPIGKYSEDSEGQLTSMEQWKRVGVKIKIENK